MSEAFSGCLARVQSLPEPYLEDDHSGTSRQKPDKTKWLEPNGSSGSQMLFKFSYRAIPLCLNWPIQFELSARK